MFGDTPLHVLDTPSALTEVLPALRGAPVLGIDTESDSFHHYQEQVCLVQVSDLRADYIIDPLGVGDLSPLGPIFADPTITKVFHGADYDVVCLKRDFGFEFRGLFDTMLAAQFLGLPKLGLADLVGQWWGHELDKRWQRHDWAARPLLPEHLEYARGDSHFLPALRDVMVRRLVRADRLGPVLEECRLLEGRQWQGRKRDPAEFTRAKGARELDDTGLRVLRAAWRYREEQAKAMDRPVFKVIPDETLVGLARARPRDLEGVGSVTRRGSPLFRRHGEGLLAAVHAGLDDAEPLPGPASEAPDPGPAPALPRHEAEALFARLKTWRNDTMQRHGVASVAVMSNTGLRELVRAAPRTLDALQAVPEVRRWQVERHGEELVALIDAVLAASAPGSGRRRRRRGRPPGAGSAA
jgi:ribonuclease D